jgi:lipopolysaccharide export system permease protein
VKILQRHIFAQVALSVSMSVGLFLFVMVTGDLLKNIFPPLSQGQITWGQFLKALLLTIPSALPYTLPTGVLAGVLIVLGRMSAQNEILAMKAAGMSLWRITSPIFAIALAATALSVVINLEFAPRALDSVKSIVVDAATTDPTRLIAPGEFVGFKQYTIYAEDRQGDQLIRPWIWGMNDKKQTVRIIRAESATVSYDAETSIFKLLLKNAGMEELDRQTPEDFSETTRFHFAESLPVEVSVDELLNFERKRKLRAYTFTELLSLRENGWQLNSEADKNDPEKRFASRITVQTQIQNNIASAFGILSMTMLAIPLGIKTSRSETLVNVGIALGLALLFYVLTIAATWIQDPHFRPDMLIWFPNILYQGIGGFLLWRAAKQ